MPQKKPFDWRDDPALSGDSHSSDLPPLPELNYGPEPAETAPQPVVPSRFTPEHLRFLLEGPEEVKRAVLNQHLARRACIAEGSEIAAVLDERISQIRAIMGERHNASQAPPSKATTAREKFIMPILVKNGWSILDWANKAGVDHHTASNYLKGKSTYPSTRKKLADALGIEPEKLPK